MSDQESEVEEEDPPEVEPAPKRKWTVGSPEVGDVSE